MSLHFTILFWLSLIFIVAGAIILAIMLKTKKESKKESYLGFTIVFFIFGLAMLIYTLLFGLSPKQIRSVAVVAERFILILY